GGARRAYAGGRAAVLVQRPRARAVRPRRPRRRGRGRGARGRPGRGVLRGGRDRPGRWRVVPARLHRHGRRLPLTPPWAPPLRGAPRAPLRGAPRGLSGAPGAPLCQAAGMNLGGRTVLVTGASGG